MCGLCGLLGPGIQYRDLDILQELSYVSGLRGTDGAGIVQGKSENYGKRKNHFKMGKSVQDISYFRWFNDRAKGGDKELFKNIQNNFFAVHTRGASRGVISNENAHPFEFTNLIGMHNGTLVDSQYHHLMKTDSEMLFGDINKKGLLTVLEALNPKSAYALVIYNKKTGEMVFARNDERELYFCFAADRAVMYWASEEWFLRGVLSRNKTDILNDEVLLIDPYKIFTIHPGALPRGTGDVFEVRDIKKPTWDGYWDQNMARRNVTHWPRQDQHRTVTQMIGYTSKKEQEEDIESIKRATNFECAELPANEKIPYRKCANCDKKLNLVQQYFGKQLEDKTVVCEECVISIPFEITAKDLKNNKDNNNDNEVRVG